MRTRIIAACLLVLPLLPGCREKVYKQFDPSGITSMLPAPATQKAGRVLQQYFRLKNALVQEQSDTAAAAAKAMKEAINDLRNDSTALYTSALPVDSLRTLTGTLSSQLDLILSAHDASCEAQRIYFKPLSEALYRLIRISGMKNMIVYHQYCPMALNEQGAYWMSLEPDIENPYFGAKMLTCGELIDTLH